jgi:hypothetical protein
MHLPEWRIGEQRPVVMPYNLEVLATYKGQMASVDLLPSHGNRIGDMYLVNRVPFV